MPLTATGHFATEKASQYLQQLCKHFSHKIDVRFDETTGEIALPPGPSRLSAENGRLVIEVTGDDGEALARAKSIIDKHLVRFAFREDFETMDWQDAA